MLPFAPDPLKAISSGSRQRAAGRDNGNTDWDLGRTDLFSLWRLPDGNFQRFVIECKVMSGSRETTMNTGTAQLLNDAERCGTADRYLVIFDKTQKNS